MRFPLAIALACVLLASATVIAEAPKNLVRDDYSTVEHPTRNAIRGDWKIADGMASVKHDDELYRKYANHGPIMVYEVPHSDAIAVVEFKPSGCKTVVFTMDAVDGGHAFRVILRSEDKDAAKSKGGPTSLICTYADKGDKEKAEIIPLSKEVPKLKDGQWNRIEISVSGDQAVVKINDESVAVEHERIAQQKKIAKLGFAFGELSIRKFILGSLNSMDFNHL